uniref:glucuronosyltransferase n=1 Tax=Leptobrachium leishanense TaxID=445787 RepID=A0A8C5WDI2_9ANUR
LSTYTSMCPLSCVLCSETSAILIPSNIRILVAAGKLLVVPADGSHWLSMHSVVELLIERGHHVVVVAPESNMNLNTSHRYEMKTYPVTVSKQQLKNHFQSLSCELFTQRTFLEKIKKHRELLNEVGDIMINICTCMLNNDHLMQTLKESYFDAVFTDPILPCGQILAELLSVPSVFFLREVPCHLDAEATLCPLPLSYVPRFFTGLTDRMTFFERLGNLLIDRTMNVHCGVVYSRFQRLISQILQRDLSVSEILSHGSIWLLRQDFVLQFPKPIMPNMIFIGGINCDQGKPLAQVGIKIFCYTQYIGGYLLSTAVAEMLSVVANSGKRH